VPGRERDRADVPTTDLPAVLADAGLLERVLANLVDNALRYATTRPVRVAASTHGTTAEIRVVDHGPGIPTGDRDAVFEPFQRRDDHATGNSAGVGLGLAIARSFTAAMHGTLTLDDTPGGGLTAVIALPVSP
jgi:two-component system, OmpR family, sensor histidine kinase KdpD